MSWWKTTHVKIHSPMRIPLLKKMDQGGIYLGGIVTCIYVHESAHIHLLCLDKNTLVNTHDTHIKMHYLAQTFLMSSNNSLFPQVNSSFQRFMQKNSWHLLINWLWEAMFHFLGLYNHSLQVSEKSWFHSGGCRVFMACQKRLWLFLVF